MPNQNLTRLARLAQLYELVSLIEQDLGLDSFSDEERAMLYAMIAAIRSGPNQFRSADIKDHPFCRKVSRPTFYRNLKKLIKKGVLSPAPNHKMGTYVLADAWHQQSHIT